MRKKMRIKTFDGKVEEVDLNIRNLFHFEVQRKTRAQVYKPKKGKGSYTRKIKYKNNEYDG